MYLIKGKIEQGLPFRLMLKDGTTRTGVDSMSQAELIQIGILPCEEVYPEKTWQQYYGEPVIKQTAKKATATYPVIDYSPAEIFSIIECARERKREEIAEARYQAEIAGVTFYGMNIKTDRESQALITGAVVKAMQDSAYTCRWKTESGFIEIDTKMIFALADTVREHVQIQFDKESRIQALIDSLDTPIEVNVILWDAVEEKKIEVITGEKSRE